MTDGAGYALVSGGRALAKVTIPILMFTAWHDSPTRSWHAEIVARGSRRRRNSCTGAPMLWPK